MIWPTRRLGELISLEYGKPLPAGERDPKGAVPAFGANGVLCHTNKSYEDGPSIIVGRKGSAGEVTFVNGPFWPTDVTYFVRHDPKITDLRYLHYLLQYLDLPKLAKGVKPGINRNDVYALEVACPPMVEQKRIVAILDEAFEGIRIATANAEKNLGGARELFDAHLNAVFEIEFRGFARLPLSNYVGIAHGFAFDGADFERSSDENLPIVLTPGNYAEDATLVFTAQNTKRYRLATPAEWLLARDDLTVVMTDLSSKMKILGKPAFVSRDDLLHNQRIGRVVFQSTTFQPRFIYYFLRTRRVLQRVRETATGTMVRHTAPKRILANEIPLVPSALQEASISRLDHLAGVVEQIREHQRGKLAQLALLKQTILGCAFSGRLTAARERAA